MASPQPDKYVRISTELFEIICRLKINTESRQVFDAIIRKTWGFNKKSDEISTKDLMQMTGLPKKSVERARKKLIDYKMITAVNLEGSYYLHYSIQKDYEKWCKTAVNLEGTTAVKTEGPQKLPTAVNLVQNCGQSMTKLRSISILPINTINTIDTKDRENLPFEIKNLKDLGHENDWIKNHFLMRGFPEAEVDLAMGKKF